MIRFLFLSAVVLLLAGCPFIRQNIDPLADQYRFHFKAPAGAEVGMVGLAHYIGAEANGQVTVELLDGNDSRVAGLDENVAGRVAWERVEVTETNEETGEETTKTTYRKITWEAWLEKYGLAWGEAPAPPE